MGSTGSRTSSSPDSYMRFNYNSDDTHYYEDDKGATAKWFGEHSNYKALVDSMSPAERMKFYWWSQGHFMRGQQYDGFSNMRESDQEAVRTYDKILDKSTLDTPIVVHRLANTELLLGKGVKNGDIREIQKMIGQDITVKGNMSTGAGSTGLTIGTPKPVDYEIRIPAGKGAGMWIGDSRINGWGDDQREFITNRDIVLRPVSVERVGSDYKTAHPESVGVKYKVVLEYQGRLDHDYS